MSKFTDELRNYEVTDLRTPSDYARGWNDASYRMKRAISAAADILDEAEKALAAYVKADGMVGQSNVTITQYDAAMEAAHALAITILARIRGEKT